MKRIAFLLVFLSMGFSYVHLQAQDTKKKKEKKKDKDDDDDDEPVPVYNYVIDDPMDAFHPVADSINSQKKAAPLISYYAVPEFYYHAPKKSRDTTFEFFCYDRFDTLIKNVTDYDSVRYFSVFKEFNDSLHTYSDNGVKKPLPVSVIVKRYDRAGKDKWISVEYPGNKFTELKEFKSVSVKVDTEMVADPAAHQMQMKIYKYYKVIKN